MGTLAGPLDVGTPGAVPGAGEKENRSGWTEAMTRDAPDQVAWWQRIMQCSTLRPAMAGVYLEKHRNRNQPVAVQTDAYFVRCDITDGSHDDQPALCLCRQHAMPGQADSGASVLSTSNAALAKKTKRLTKAIQELSFTVEVSGACRARSGRSWRDV